MVLGRSAGLTEEKLAHLGDDPLPDGVYTGAERAIVEYAQRSTRMVTIDQELYARLTTHFGQQQVIEICLTVGLSNLINRFHATFLTEVDDATNQSVGPACAMPMPDELRQHADEGWNRSSG